MLIISLMLPLYGFSSLNQYVWQFRSIGFVIVHCWVKNQEILMTVRGLLISSNCDRNCITFGKASRIMCGTPVVCVAYTVKEIFFEYSVCQWNDRTIDILTVQYMQLFSSCSSIGVENMFANWDVHELGLATNSVHHTFHPVIQKKTY